MSENNRSEKTGITTVLKNGLTPRMLIIIPLWTAFGSIITLWSTTFGEWWSYYGWFPFPPFVLLLFLNVLGRIHPKLRLNEHEAVLLLTSSLIISGGAYFIYGEKIIIACFPWYGQFAPLVMKAGIFAGEMSAFIPSFMVPATSAALQAWQSGGVIDWPAWMPSTLYWCAWALIYLFCSYFWMFFMIKPLIRVERLPFPQGAPTVWTVEQFTTEQEGKPRIFRWKNVSTKAFYVFFAIGAIVVFPDIIRFWFPSVPAGSELRLHNVNLTPYTTNILPGAFTNLWFDTALLGASILMPLDILASIMLLYLIFYVAYPVIGIKLGVLPYTVGVESSSSYYASETGIFKYGLFATYGVGLGLALVYIYRYRNEFLNIFKATFGNKTVPQEEDGLSYRFIGIGTIISTLMMVGFLIGSGVPFGPAITMVFFWVMGNFMFILVTSVMYYNAAWFTANYSSAIYDAGSLTAGWPSVPPSSMTSTATTYMLWSSTSPGNFTGGFSPKSLMYAFKLAEQTKTQWKEIFYTILITTIVLVVIQHLSYVPWTIHFGGISKMNSIGYYYWAIIDSWGYTVTGSGLFKYIPPVEQYSYTVVGVVAAILLSIARTQWSWFIFNPLSILWLSLASSVTFSFLSYVGAFIIKLLALRLGGSKAHDSIVLPGAVGYCMGYGTMTFILNLIYFFMVPVPRVLG